MKLHQVKRLLPAIFLNRAATSVRVCVNYFQYVGKNKLLNEPHFRYLSFNCLIFFLQYFSYFAHKTIKL